MVEIEFLFSTWIFVWFILYYIGLIEYSPVLILMIGLLQNAYVIGLMAINKVRFLTIIQFATIVFFAKFIPFYLIRNDKIKVDDIIFSLLLFNLYIVWLLINHMDVVQISKDSVNSMITDHPQMAFMMVLQNLENKLKGYFR